MGGELSYDLFPVAVLSIARASRSEALAESKDRIPAGKTPACGVGGNSGVGVSRLHVDVGFADVHVPLKMTMTEV
jgi:hypothetical protein